MFRCSAWNLIGEKKLAGGAAGTLRAEPFLSKYCPSCKILVRKDLWTRHLSMPEHHRRVEGQKQLNDLAGAMWDVHSARLSFNNSTATSKKPKGSPPDFSTTLRQITKKRKDRESWEGTEREPEDPFPMQEGGSIESRNRMDSRRRDR